ncbi:MAG: thiamine ABC transporter substrate-binding protein [Thermoplasmataceae archaeon]
MSPAGNKEQKDRKYVGYRRKVIALAIVVIVVVAGFSVYYFIRNEKHGNVLVVYSYDSFMAYGCNTIGYNFNAIFGHFEREYNVTIEVVNQSDPLAILEAKASHPSANIVLGLTNMNAVTAEQEHLLVKYSPPGLSYINSTLIAEMGSASSYVIPYEYSYLGIDYNKTFVAGYNFTPSFKDLLSSSNASNLLLENPALDSTGLGFLLWEIAYYKFLLKQNWQSWWSGYANNSNAKNHIFDTWGDAFNVFNTGPETNLASSYLTDPAYYHLEGYGPLGSAVSYWNGSAYGWRTIYGIGIVNGSANLPLEEAFVNYFLSPRVQNLIPENEWMYPANSTIQLPALYGMLPNPDTIISLNNYMNASYIAENMANWILQWDNLGLR